MSFNTDKQTLDDLTIFGRRGDDCIYGIFNHTRTRGGADVLEQFFRTPMSDVAKINKRSAIIRHFQSWATAFPFEPALFDTIEHYLSQTDERSKLGKEENTLGRKFNTIIGADTAYQQVSKGVMAVVQLLAGLTEFLKQLRDHPLSAAYQEEEEAIRQLMATPGLGEQEPSGKLSFEKVAELDKLFRYVNRDLLKRLLHYCYNLDVYMTVAQVAATRNFVFPTALQLEEHSLELEGVYHPQVKGAIGNDLRISPSGSIIFLTGANMAGKSTFMKSLGIAMFLAHMGFPVAAKKMQFSVRDGVYTTINLSDNLSMGASHFYAEVLRLKKIALELRLNKNLFVIFDELFRGTNVKDAYEATIAITSAFAGRPNSMFIISTHIIEAGTVLKEKCSNINFVYLPTLMDGNKPVYTYQLKQGITEDRHGMVIINNERIIEILRSRKQTLN